MDEGKGSAEAAKYYFWATLLAFWKPNGKYKPIAVDTVARRLVSCCFMKVALPGTRYYFAPHQIATGVPTNTKVAIHALRERLGIHGWNPGRAALLMDVRNAFNEVDKQKILDAVNGDSVRYHGCV